VPAQELIDSPGHVGQMVNAWSTTLVMAVHPTARLGCLAKDEDGGKKSTLLRSR